MPIIRASSRAWATSLRHAGAVRRHRDRIVAQGQGRRLGHDRAIDAATERHGDTLQGTQYLQQAITFGLQFAGERMRSHGFIVTNQPRKLKPARRSFIQHGDCG